MNITIKISLCAFLLSSLTACKIELNIFSNNEDDKVLSTSGHFDCTNDPENSDCVQQYMANIEDCDGYDVNDTAKDEWAELPNCTYVPDTEEATYEETLVAVPAEGSEFDGWADFCLQGAGLCVFTVEGDRDPESEAIVEAHFGEPANLQDADYTFDYKGRRASKTVNSVTTYFIYDLNDNLIGEYNASGNPVREYVYLEGQLLAQYDYVPSATEPEQHYYFNDHLGTPVYMINRDMDPTYQLTTGPFGEAYGEFKLAGMVQPARFPGQYGDEETGYNYNWNRFMDSSTGRYLQVDRLDVLSRAYDPELWVAEEMGAIRLPRYMAFNHPYGYANQNPVMNIDPYGLVTVCYMVPGRTKPLCKDVGNTPTFPENASQCEIRNMDGSSVECDCKTGKPTEAIPGTESPSSTPPSQHGNNPNNSSGGGDDRKIDPRTGLPAREPSEGDPYNAGG